jgi:hypothetical protein
LNSIPDFRIIIAHFARDSAHRDFSSEGIANQDVIFVMRSDGWREPPVEKITVRLLGRD